MNIDISKLKNNIVEKLEIDETLEYTTEYLENTSIKKLSPVKVKGFIQKLNEEVYLLDIKIEGVMTLEDTLTLELIENPFKIFINENIEDRINEEEIIKINENILDIIGIVWENIVLEIPMRITKSEKLPQMSGDGWALVDEIEDENPFKELSNMIDREE